MVHIIWLWYAYDMAQRTTIVLGPPERRAARQLASRWGVTPSEAIRRAVLRVAEEELGTARDRRRRHRVAALEALIKLSGKHDVAAELKRISEERDAW